MAITRQRSALLGLTGLTGLVLVITGCAGGGADVQAPVSQSNAPAGTSGTSGTASAGTASTGTDESAPPSSAGTRQATVVLNGDLLWHDRLTDTAREDAQAQGRTGPDDLDFSPLLAGLRPVIEGADLAVCQFEVPVAPAGGPYRYYPTFEAPPQTVAAVRTAGFDLCTTATNHSLDDGWPGVQRTVDTLRGAGLLVSGTALTAQEAEQPVVFTTADGVKVAVISGTFGTNGIARPSGRAWSVADLDPDRLLQQAAAARAAGADIVLVGMHAGEEYVHQPNAQQRRLAERLTASPDVDLVYGHHAHVVQPWTKVNGKWVLYGLGNLVAQHRTPKPASWEGATARLTFTETTPGTFTVDKAELIPTFVTEYQPGQPARLLVIKDALAGNTPPGTTGALDRERLLTAQERTRRVVHELGGADGLVEP